MLKVKADRINELKDFGFFKYFDCRTGELLYYDLFIDKEHRIVLKVDVKDCIGAKPFELRIISFALYGYSDDYKEKALNDFVNFIYDITKADMVEKVVEDGRI